jgi:hypothetical protein
MAVGVRLFVLAATAWLLPFTLSSAYAQPSPPQRPWLEEPMVWGVNGHPFTAYPNIPWGRQLDDTLRLGMQHYRVNTRGDGSHEYMDTLLPMAEARGVVILPMIQPEVDWVNDTPEAIYERAYALGRSMASRYRGRVPVWSLANEIEGHALLRPCERFDDGTPYPCEWGISIGATARDYHGGRWAQVSAVYRGLSEGVRAGDPEALRAIGVAGWGRFGAFERMHQDGIAWEITVWHDYEGVSEEAVARLTSFGRPIWLMEFNAGADSDSPAERARQVAERVAHYQRLRALYPIAGAFFYELYDEPYWGDTFEARQGLISLRMNWRGFWEVGPDKPGAGAISAAIAAARAVEGR